MVIDVLGSQNLFHIGQKMPSPFLLQHAHRLRDRGRHMLRQTDWQSWDETFVYIHQMINVIQTNVIRTNFSAWVAFKQQHNNVIGTKISGLAWLLNDHSCILSNRLKLERHDTYNNRI
jgi:hypothetical protein